MNDLAMKLTALGCKDLDLAKLAREDLPVLGQVTDLMSRFPQAFKRAADMTDIELGATAAALGLRTRIDPKGRRVSA
jgi:hypothetical protein